MDKGQQRLADILDFAQRELGKCVRDFTLGRWSNKWGYRWKRMRKSLKHKRDEEAFEQAKLHLKTLHKQEKEHVLDLFYFDGMGVSLTPSVPYGWQMKGERILMPSKRSQNQTVFRVCQQATEKSIFPFQRSCQFKSGGRMLQPVCRNFDQENSSCAG